MSASADHFATVRRYLALVINAPERLAELEPAEMDLGLRLARRARVLGRLGARLEEAGRLDDLSLVAADQLRSALVMAESRERLARWELDRIAWAMGDDTETPLVALKGCAYILLGLPLATGRIFADVDLLTSEERLPVVERALNARGWETATLTPYDDNYYRRWTHELPPLTHREREVEVDLHHNILPRTGRLNPDGNKLLERARAVPGSRYKVLAPEDMVLHAMTHLMFADDLVDKIRELVDIADLLGYFQPRDEAFWDRFVERAPELDLQRPAFYGLRYAERLLDVTLPPRAAVAAREWGPPRPVLSLMDRLVDRALYPRHPDHPDRSAAVAGQLLFMRSHWIRMPPWLLAYHLCYKFMVTRLRRDRSKRSNATR